MAALYEQGKVHHLGSHPKLEDEMTQWNPLTDKRSPNRVDWLVWALTELMLDDELSMASAYAQEEDSGAN